MQSIMTVLLSMAANFLQSPAGQQKLIDLLPTIMGYFQSFIDKINQAKQAGADAEAQKVALAAHITDLVTAAAAQAEADHKAHPTDDTGFDPGVFRD